MEGRRGMERRLPSVCTLADAIWRLGWDSLSCAVALGLEVAPAAGTGGGAFP
ncbi:MAG: hypothetical protein RLZZ387_3795, partial [Chloroflexota bacterium]